MKILMIVSEMDGMVKTGGLADFASALPQALIRRGHDVRVILPLYKGVTVPQPPDGGKGGISTGKRGKKGGRTDKDGYHGAVKSDSIYFDMNYHTRYGCLVHRTELGSVPVLLVEHHHFFSREGGIYGYDINPYEDNALRFAFLCKAAIEHSLHDGWIPDIIHCNDWQSAIAPFYLKEHYRDNPLLKRCRSVLTIHNGEYQGKSSAGWIDELGIRRDLFTSETMEEYGYLNLLKCGIMYADGINAVSPGYSEELLMPESSHNLWHYLNRRRDSFTGILNGCDYSQWDPSSDPFLPHHFSSSKMEGKERCRSALRKRMNLPEEAGTPVIGIVARLTAQKGFDYLLPAMERILYEGHQLQFVVLGSGEPYYGSYIHHVQQRYPQKLGFVNGYDNALSHMIEAGSDFFLMPSLFEPCGLNQLYSLAYGTLPIVRETGGLKDTVICLTHDRENRSEATGLGFVYPEPDGCYDAMRRALYLYSDVTHLYREMQQRAMTIRFTWEESAKNYEKFYMEL